MMFFKQLINTNQIAIKMLGADLKETKLLLKKITAEFNEHKIFMENGLKELASRNEEINQDLNRIENWKSDQTKNIINILRKVNK